VALALAAMRLSDKAKARQAQARGFHEHLIPEFERSPTDPLHLLPLLKHIRRTLRGQWWW
jgi:hypothetical protein